MKEKKVENFSSKGVYASTLATLIAVGAIWFMTNNIVVTIISGILIPALVMLLFHKQVTGRGKIASSAALAALLLVCGFFFSANVIKDPVIPDPQEPQISIEEPEEEEEDDNDDGDQGAVISYGPYVGGFAKPNPWEVITPTYSNTGGSSDTINNNPTENVEVITSDETPAVIEDPTVEEEYEQMIEDAKEEGEDVFELDEGIVAIVDNRDKEEKPTQPPKDESTKVDLTDQIASAVEIPSQENPNKVETPPAVTTPDKDEDKTETPKKPSSETLLEWEASTKPSEEPVTGGNTESGNGSSNTTTPAPTTPVVPEDTDSEELDDEVSYGSTSGGFTNVVSTITPVSIVSLDGATAFAGDSVQFKVTGSVASIEGLDGLDYTYSNGCITVNTEPGTATVITVTVIGEDGSTATASITINVLPF